MAVIPLVIIHLPDTSLLKEWQVSWWVSKMTSWAYISVPEDTGRLLSDFIRTLALSDEHRLLIGCPTTPYASYVNAMMNVHWTKPTSRYSFFDVAINMAYQYLNDVIQKRKYLEARAYNSKKERIVESNLMTRKERVVMLSV